MFAVRTRISDTVKNVQALAAAALIPAAAMGGEPPASTNEPFNFSELSFPSSSYRVPPGSQNIIRFDSQSAFLQGPPSTPRLITSLHPQYSLSAFESRPQHLVFADAQELPQLIGSVSNLAAKFRARHPALGGTLAFPEIAEWNLQADKIILELRTEKPLVMDQRLTSLKRELSDFESALNLYDGALEKLAVLSARFGTNAAAAVRLDARGSRAISEHLAEATRELIRGNASYLPILRSAEFDVGQMELAIKAEADAKRRRTIVSALVALAVGAGGALVAATRYLGSAPFFALAHSVMPLLFSRRLSLNDRISFLKTIRNAGAMSKFLLKEEPETGRRAGKFLAGMTGLLHRQFERGMYSKLYRMVSQAPLRSKSDLHGLMADILVEPLVIKMLWPGTDKAKNQAVEEQFRQIAAPDGPPCKMENENHEPTKEAARFYGETIGVMRRGVQLHRGFSALAFEAKGLPSMPPLLARFLFDTSSPEDGDSAVGRLNAASPVRFPGPGIACSGASLTRLFGEPGPGESMDDVLQPWKQAWPWATDALREVARERVIYSQMGYFATNELQDPRYFIRDIHYSYVVFNEHLPGTRMQGAYLVPSAAVTALFEGSIIPLADYVGPTESFRLPKMHSPTAFLRYCEKFGPVVHLTANSNLGGSLVNGYAPNRPPFHAWEQEKYPNSGSRDAWGHVHKTMINGGYEYDWSGNLEEPFAPLKAAHAEILQLASRYQNNLDVRRLRYADWKKGYIPRRWGSEFGADSAERWSTDRSDDGVISMNPGRFLMLDEVFHWHAHGRKDNLPKERLPVLSLGKIFNYFDAPDRTLALDSRDLSLRYRGKLVVPPIRAIPGAAIDLRTKRAEMERLWVECNLNELEPSADLRLYHRESIVR